MERGTHHGEGGTGTIECKYEKKNRLEMPRGLKGQDHKASRGEQGNALAILGWSVIQEHKAECSSHLHNSYLNLSGIVWSLRVAEHEPMQAAWSQCGFLTSLVWAAWPPTSEQGVQGSPNEVLSTPKATDGWKERIVTTWYKEEVPFCVIWEHSILMPEWGVSYSPTEPLVMWDKDITIRP